MKDGEEKKCYKCGCSLEWHEEEDGYYCVNDDCDVSFRYCDNNRPKKVVWTKNYNPFLHGID